MPGARDPEGGDTAALRAVLAGHPPFAGLDAPVRAELVRAARLRRLAADELVLDAFATGSVELFVVVAGRVAVWNDADRTGEAADENLGPGGVFGFCAMLTERSVGPRVVATEPVIVAAIPAAAAEPVFASAGGARFLAAQGVPARPGPVLRSYSLVDDLIEGPPLLVAATDAIGDVAARMTEHGTSCAVVPLGGGRHGLVTDALLRRRVVAEGLPGSAPAREVVDDAVPTALLGDSAAEAQISLLDRDADHLLVTDRTGTPRGVVTARQFSVSPGSAGVSVHEQVRRAATVEELTTRARRVPAMLDDLLSAGLASAKVVAVYSTVVDTIVRRAIALVFAEHPDLSRDAFTWLALGSNGRREAVLSSDVDSAVAFDDADDGDALGAAGIDRYRPALARVDDVLGRAGLVRDEHGATARRPAFARTNAQWRAAATRWMAAPDEDQGAVMTSLLVDGRPIHGDPGLPAVTAVFGDLRRHPGTMRMLLQESLAVRARTRSLLDVFSRRDTVDLKSDALLPVVNTARWAALSVGSASLSTVGRLRDAAGSPMLPAEQAANLVDVFEVLQRLRLRYQLIAYRRGDPASDVLTREQMSPMDRSVVDEAVREIAAVQRRMDNIAVRVPLEEWAAPAHP